jgi:hypothetical protein
MSSAGWISFAPLGSATQKVGRTVTGDLLGAILASGPIRCCHGRVLSVS